MLRLLSVSADGKSGAPVIKFRQRIANWCTLHHIPLRLYLWLCPKHIHVQCGHPQCLPCIANPVGICLDGQMWRDKDGKFYTYRLPEGKLEAV